MLLKNEIKGTLESIGEIKQGKNGSYQNIRIRIAARVDGAGIAIGNDELFTITIFGDEKIRETWKGLSDAGAGTKVKLSVYLNSYVRETDQGDFDNLNLTLKNISAL